MRYLAKNDLCIGSLLQGTAREAGEINKSLLTMGRCINALVDHSGHIL